MSDPKLPFGSRSDLFSGIDQFIEETTDEIRRRGNQSIPPAGAPVDGSITTVGLWRQIQAQEIMHMAQQLATQNDTQDLTFNADLEDSFIPDANRFLGFPREPGVGRERLREEEQARQQNIINRSLFGENVLPVAPPQMHPLDYARDPRTSHNQAVERLFTSLRNPQLVSNLAGLDYKDALEFAQSVNRFIPGLRQAKPWVPGLFGAEQQSFPGGRDEAGLQGFDSVEALAVDRAARHLAGLLGPGNRSSVDTIRAVRDQLLTELAPSGSTILSGALRGFTHFTEFTGGLIRDPYGVASAGFEADISSTNAVLSEMFEFGREQGRAESGITLNWIAEQTGLARLDQAFGLSGEVPLGNVDLIKEGAFLAGDITNVLPFVGVWPQIKRGLNHALAAQGRRQWLKEGEFLTFDQMSELGRALNMTDDDVRMFASPIGGAADIEDPAEMLLASRAIDEATMRAQEDAIMRATAPLREGSGRINIFGGADLPSVDNLIRTREFLDGYFESTMPGVADAVTTAEGGAEILAVGRARRAAQSSLFTGDFGLDPDLITMPGVADAKPGATEYVYRSGPELDAIRSEVADRLEAEFPHIAGSPITMRGAKLSDLIRSGDYSPIDYVNNPNLLHGSSRNLDAEEFARRLRDEIEIRQAADASQNVADKASPAVQAQRAAALEDLSETAVRDALRLPGEDDTLDRLQRVLNQEQAEALFTIERATEVIHELLLDMRFGVNRIAGGADVSDLRAFVEAGAAAQNRAVHPGILRAIERTDRGLPRHMLDTVIEKLGHVPIARYMIENIALAIPISAPLQDRLTRISYVASADTLRADVIRAETFVRGWLPRADALFGGLDDALLATPLPGTAHRVSGKFADVIENKQFYDLNDEQLALLDELQTFFTNDLNLTRAYGADWGKIMDDYIAHIYEPEVGRDIQRAIDRGTRSRSKFHVNSQNSRTFPTLRDAIDASDDLSARVITDVEVLIRTRLLASARARARLQASEVLKAKGSLDEITDVADPVRFKATGVSGLEDYYFTATDAQQIANFFGDDDKLRILDDKLYALETVRELVLSLDGSFMSISGLLGFLVKPRTSIRALPAATAAFGSTAYWNQWLANNGEFLAWASERGFKLGLANTTTEHSADIFARLARTHPKLFGVDLGGPQRLFGRGVFAINQRGFGRAITVQRAAMLRRNLELVGFAEANGIQRIQSSKARDKFLEVVTRSTTKRGLPETRGFRGKTLFTLGRDVDPELAARDAIRNINQMIPMMNFEELALTKTQQRLQRAPLISPSYWVGPQQFVKDLFDFTSPRGQFARMSAVEATITGTTLAFAISSASGYSEQWRNIIDPTSKDFLTAFTPWGRIRLGGPYRSTFRMIMPTDKYDGWFEGVKTGIGYKVSPAISTGFDLASNKDFFDAEINTKGGFEGFMQQLTYLGIQSSPLVLQSVKNAMDAGLDFHDFLADISFNALGASFSPYSPFFQTTTQIAKDQEAGILPRYQTTESGQSPVPIESYSDLNRDQRLAFDQKYPELAQDRLEFGNDDYSESVRQKDALVGVTVTNVRTHVDDFLATAAGEPDARITTAKNLSTAIGEEISLLINQHIGIDIGQEIDHESKLESEDPNERALATYYDIVINQAKRGGVLDPLLLDRLLSDFDASLTPTQRDFVEERNGKTVANLRSEIPALRIYYEAKDLVQGSPIFEIDDQIWATAQQVFGTLNQWDTFDDYVYYVASQMSQATGTTLQSILSQGPSHPDLKKLDVISFVIGERKSRQDPIFIANPELAGAMLLLGWRQSFEQAIQVGAQHWMDVWITRMRTAGTGGEEGAAQIQFPETLGNVGPSIESQEIIQLRAEGLTHGQIAAETGASESAVSSALRRHRRATGAPVSPTT